MSALSILIAEDDADDRFLIQKALEESDKGFKIDFVANGVELIDHLYKIKNEKQGKKYPRFILLDLNMPKMDGREVLKNIKTNDSFKNIPVIILSTTKNQSEVRHCYELGANTYIVKPSSFESLVKIIHQVHTYWFQIATLADAV